MDGAGQWSNFVEEFQPARGIAGNLGSALVVSGLVHGAIDRSSLSATLVLFTIGNVLIIPEQRMEQRRRNADK